MPKTASVKSVMLLVCGGHFIIDFMTGIWPAYKTMVEVDIALAGVLVAVCAFIGETSQLASGPLTDRGYGKTIVLIGVALSSFMALISNVSSFSSWGVFILCAYMGSGIFHPAAAGLVGMINHPKKGMLMALFASSGSLGSGCSQLLFSQLYYSHNKNTALLMLPAILLLFWAAFQNFGNLSVPHIEKFRFKQIGMAAKNRSFRNLYLCVFCLQSFAWSAIFLIPDILAARQMPTWVAFGAGHMAYMLGGAFMVLPAGAIADKIGEKWVIIIFAFLAWISCALFLAVETLSIPYISAALFFLGGTIYSCQPNSLNFGNRIIPGCPGLVSTCLMGLVWILAEGVGPIMSGYLASIWGSNGAAQSLAVMSGLIFIAIGFVSQATLPEKQLAQAGI